MTVPYDSTVHACDGDYDAATTIQEICEAVYSSGMEPDWYDVTINDQPRRLFVSSEGNFDLR